MKILQSTNQSILQSFVNSLNTMAGFPNDGTQTIIAINKHTTQDLWFIVIDCLPYHIGDVNQNQLTSNIDNFKNSNQGVVSEEDKTVEELYSELYKVLD